MRLYDFLRHIDPSFPPTTVLIADEIAEELDRDETPDQHSWPAASYGVVAPPWPLFFVEAHTSFAHNGRRILAERGVLVRDVTDHPHVQQRRHLPRGVQVPAGTHWILTLYGFMRVDRGNVRIFPGQLFLHLDRTGVLLDDPDAVPLVHYPPIDLLSDAEYMPLDRLATFAPFVLRAIGALHQHVPVEQVTPNRQQRREAQRKHGVELHEHYVLKVQPRLLHRRAPLPAPLNQHVPAQQKRAHGVRGHFRYYTEDKPLFGRITGAVWIPAHTRGRNEAGNITKDYAIDLRDPQEPSEY